MELNYNSILKAYQRQYSAVRRADLSEAIFYYENFSRPQTDRLLIAYNENLKEEAYQRILKKLSDKKRIELVLKESEEERDEYIRELRIKGDE